MTAINGKISVATVCPLCGDTKVLTLPEKGYIAWQDGENIQDALPDLDINDRERLISGICPVCWNEMFSYDPDDDEDYDDCDYEVGYDPYMGCFTDDC